MKISSDLTRINTIDLSKEIVVANPVITPLVSLLYSRGKTTVAKDTFVKKKIKTLSSVASGARKEGADAPAVENTSFAYVDNNLEIFSKATSVSRTAGVIEGNVTTALAKEINDRLIEMKGDIS